MAAAALSAALLGAATADARPRIMGSSISLAKDRFEVRTLVEDDPRGEVARIVYTVAPACPGDPATARFAKVPPVTVTASAPKPPYRVFEATIPDPSRGAVGAWTLHAVALDAAGAAIARYESGYTHSFPPRFRALGFEGLPVGPDGAAALDTTGRPASARLLLDLEHDAAIASVGVTTSIHVDPAIDVVAGGALAAHRAAATTPSVTGAIERRGPTTLAARFDFPRDVPATTMAVERMFLVDARCRTAELGPPRPLALAVGSASPRAMPFDIHVDRGMFASNRVEVRFRHRGPARRTAPAPEIGGIPAPVVTVRLLDAGPPAKVLASAPARPVPSSPLSERPWDGESMRIQLALTPALRAAFAAGVLVEIDDGTGPIAPRAVLTAR